MSKTTKAAAKRTLDARPDTLDFRDKMYEPTLYEVPTMIDLEKDYMKFKVPILDQGQEGACTGFGLATVANYLLIRRKVVPNSSPVSARMIYEMARRYDEWPGENYSGSSARGAMKGWHKHGICSAECWPYKSSDTGSLLNDARTSDALNRPLGAYYRVNHKDLVAMHTAMAEVGILYATGIVHAGWNAVKGDGLIPYKSEPTGGHAFAIVAYDGRGFWIQNSWGNDWGKQGFALITYDDWLEHGTDVWVARLGAPVTLYNTKSIAIGHSAAAEKTRAYTIADLRPHIISVGNNGVLKEGGSFGTSTAEVKAIFNDDFPRVTKDWKKKRILLYAHGGLVSEDGAIQRLADYREALLEAEVYPVSFIWHSDYWSTATNILVDSLRRRRPEGILDSAKDFMLDRLDDALEPIARSATGKMQWDEMKENGLAATINKAGAARLVLKYVAALAEKYGKDFEIHIAGHSAGSIFHGPLIQMLTAKGKITSGDLKGTTGLGLKIESCTLWAPACTVALFKAFYLPAIKSKAIDRFALFALTDEAERDDNCASIYHKSLLYLVSNAFEEQGRIPLFRDGVPILGMEKFLKKDDELVKLFRAGNKTCELILSPNAAPEGSIYHATATHHGDFDDDKPTVNATLARILSKGSMQNQFQFSRSASSMKDRRKAMDAA
jgi:hypothetical protein